MAGPITWRNVSATTNTSGIAALLNGGQRAASQGFEALQGVLDERRATEDANFEQGNKNITNDFMKQLYSYNSNEDFQKARESGELQQLLESTGNRGDQSAMLKALDTRGGALRDRDTSRNLFADETQLRNQRGIEATYRQMLLENPAKAQEYLRANSEGMIGAGKLAIEGQGVAFDQQDQRNQNQETANSTARVNIARAGSARAQRAQDRQFADLDRQQAERDRLKQLDHRVADVTASYNESASRYAGAVKQTMVDLGLASDPAAANPTSLTADQKKTLNQRLEAQGITNPGSTTDARNRALQALDGEFDLGASEVSALSSSFENTLGVRKQLSAAEQEQLKQEHALELAALEKEKASNPLYRDPTTNVAEERTTYLKPVMDSLSKGGGFKAWFGNERKQVGDDFDKWTTGAGFPLIKGSRKESDMVKVPPKLWLEAWTEAEAKSDPEDHVEDILREKLNNMNIADLQLKSERTNQGILQSNAHLRQRLLNGNKAGLSDSDIMRALR